MEIRKRVNRQNTQEMCPFNVRFTREAVEPGYSARGSPSLRAGRAGFARDVCVAIGNWLSDGGEPAGGRREAVIRWKAKSPVPSTSS